MEESQPQYNKASSSNLQDLKNLLLQSKQLKCIKNNIAINVCSEKQCSESGLICGQYQCQCQNTHFKCKNVLLRRIIKNLIQKNKQIPKQVKQSYLILYQKINIMIDQLSNLKAKFQIQQQYFGLSRQDLNFVQFLKQAKYDKICGKIIHQMQNTMQSSNQFGMLSKQQIIKSFHKDTQLFQKLITSIDQKYSKRDKTFIYSKNMFLNVQQNKLCFYYQIPKQKRNTFKCFDFVPLKVNQCIGEFKSGYYKMMKNNICLRVLDPISAWRQVVSEQELPRNGKFFFEVQIHNYTDNNMMIGILTQQLLNEMSTYFKNQSMNYYTLQGMLYPQRLKKIGRGLTNYKGLISVLIDLDDNQIHWCIDRQYQGKYEIFQNLKNKKLYAKVETHFNGTTFQFKNQLQTIYNYS